MTAAEQPSAPSLPAGLVGRKVAGYRLESEIGRGGMAVVYRAKDLRLGRTVAVKLLAPELARNEVFRQRFMHESEAAAAIDHPHIIPVFEAGEHDGILFIAMRFVEGGDLRALMNRGGPFPVERTARLALQIASALDAAHDHDLVHRDVKPGNVLVAAGTDSEHPEHLYLADFGLTKKSLSLSGLTSVGQIVGTLDYAAPEQISGKPLDGRCDQYSLGCVVFEMLAGAPPFRRESDLALLWAHLNDTPPTLHERRPDLPAAVEGVITRALAKTPGERYASCLQFVAELRAATASAAARPAPGRWSGDGPPTQVVPVVSPGGPRAVPEPPRWAAPVVHPPSGAYPPSRPYSPTGPYPRSGPRPPSASGGSRPPWPP
ncbi:serine/threonine-protein kinase [Streptomyces sp. NRRL S-350]|uniref:serine/threonine-protein kinase n=1 Tax=Streptomyces sp. NRRL S-350 TaxID=1463902 RepID=UPI00099BF928|nr:serine/threonine-protein kinase [Streptomyces sp. NRRL S-350]